jgi:hypothetical protein
MSQDSLVEDKIDEFERQDVQMTQLNPEMDVGSQDKGELRIDTLEPSAIEDMDMANDPQFRGKVNYNGLSPVTRKSERERKNISYDKLNKGAQDSDDDGQGSPGGNNPNILSQSKDASMKAKKLSMGGSTDMKRTASVETQKKIEDMLELLKRSPHAYLFN